MIIKNTILKSIIKLFMTSNYFNRNFAVLNWGNSIILKRTKPIVELIKTEITEGNILDLKFKYHSSHHAMAENVAEVDSHLNDKKQLILNIWKSEQKEMLIKKEVLNLTDETNIKFYELLNAKVFDEKYGNNYFYFITLHLNVDILKAKFSELTLKYILKTKNKNNDMTYKTKFYLTKNEARKLCSMISYWKK
jgi:hypothetical protein